MIRVLVVDEELLMCSVVASVLTSQDDIEVAGMVTTIEDALARVSDCDVILVSTSMPDNGALELARDNVDKELSAQVIVKGLGGSEQETLKYIEAGADGFVLKGSDVDEMIDEIRTTASGMADVSPKLARALMERVAELTRKCEDIGIVIDGAAELTEREMEILECLANGMSNQQIADRLYIEVGTVKNHVHRVLRKLDAGNRNDAARYFSLMKASNGAPFSPDGHAVPSSSEEGALRSPVDSR